MTRAAHPETTPARPYFSSLRCAVSCFLADKDNDHTVLKLDRWAATYCCSTADVQAEFDRQLSAASLQPSNSYETPEGK